MKTLIPIARVEVRGGEPFAPAMRRLCQRFLAVMAIPQSLTSLIDGGNAWR